MFKNSAGGEVAVDGVALVVGSPLGQGLDDLLNLLSCSVPKLPNQ